MSVDVGEEILSSSGVLPRNYFKRIKKIAGETLQEEYADSGMLDYEVEYYPTSSPN